MTGFLRNAALGLFGCGALFAGVQSRSEPPAEERREAVLELSREMRKEVIEAVLKRLAESYVFPDVARAMEESVLRRLQADEYEGITDGRDLARTLTAHLREVSRDLHLGVDYFPEPRPDLSSREPSADERERMRRFARSRNFGFRKIERLSGNVGLLVLEGFFPPEEAGDTASAAMTFLSSADALIIDLRENHGGAPGMVQLLASYLFEGDSAHLNDIYSRRDGATRQYWSLPYLPGKRFVSKEVYVLTSKRTPSAAEEFAYDLQCLKRAVIVGETTWGGAHPTDGLRINDHFWVNMPVARAINPVTKTNWEGTGVKPDVEVPAERALETAHLLALKKLAEKEVEPRRAERLEEHVRELERKLEGPDPLQAVPAMVRLLEAYQVVGLSDLHGCAELLSFVEALVEAPGLKVNDITFESGNVRYQHLMDRFILEGEDVPIHELRAAWRNNTQMNTFGDTPALLHLLRTIREVNRKRPPGERMRVLCLDPPVDWTKIHSREDVRPEDFDRETHMMEVLEREVYAKGRKALFFAGGAHLARGGGGPDSRIDAPEGIEQVPFGEASKQKTDAGPQDTLKDVAEKPRSLSTPLEALERRHPGTTFAISIHEGFGDRARELEARLLEWPRPALARIRGTWYGEAAPPPSGDIFIGPDKKPVVPRGDRKIQDRWDAVLYLGRRGELTRVDPPPPESLDRAFLDELRRRGKALGGGHGDFERPSKPRSNRFFPEEEP